MEDFLADISNTQKLNSFASTQTLEGLRITIKSVLDLIKFLVLDIKYTYVLTAKFNQDCLEVSHVINFVFYIIFLFSYLQNVTLSI